MAGRRGSAAGVAYMDASAATGETSCGGAMRAKGRQPGLSRGRTFTRRLSAYLFRARERFAAERLFPLAANEREPRHSIGAG